MDIKDTALKYLAARSRTVSETERYLSGKGFGAEDTAEALEYLREMGYLNDVSYCREFFTYAFGKGWGMRRVNARLRELGVGKPDIEQAVAAYEEEYETDMRQADRSRAEKQGEKIAASCGGTDEKALAKIGRRLTALGYDADIVYQVVGRFMKE